MGLWIPWRARCCGHCRASLHPFPPSRTLRAAARKHNSFCQRAPCLHFVHAFLERHGARLRRLRRRPPGRRAGRHRPARRDPGRRRSGARGPRLDRLVLSRAKCCTDSSQPGTQLFGAYSAGTDGMKRNAHQRTGASCPRTGRTVRSHELTPQHLKVRRSRPRTFAGGIAIEESERGVGKRDVGVNRHQQTTTSINT